MESRKRPYVRIGAVVVLTVSMVYLAKLGGLSMATHRAREVEQDLSTDVAELQSSVDALGTSVHDAESDSQVEHWAREDRKWVREGDQAIVPVPATSASGAATPTPSSEDGAWERFRRWLGGGE